MSHSRKKCSKTSTATALLAFAAGTALAIFAAVNAAQKRNKSVRLLEGPVNTADNFLKSEDAQSFFSGVLGVNITDATIKDIASIPDKVGNITHAISFSIGINFALNFTALLLILALYIQIMRRGGYDDYNHLPDIENPRP